MSSGHSLASHRFVCKVHLLLSIYWFKVDITESECTPSEASCNANFEQVNVLVDFVWFHSNLSTMLSNIYQFKISIILAEMF